MYWTFGLVVAAFVTGFVALNLRSASERARALLVALSLGGPALMVAGLPRLAAPWSAFAASGYALACLVTLACTLRSAWKIEPRRVALAAGEAAAALTMMGVVLSLA